MASIFDDYVKVCKAFKSRYSKKPDLGYSLKFFNGSKSVVYVEPSKVPDVSVLLNDHFPKCNFIDYEIIAGDSKIKSGRLEVKESEPVKQASEFDKLMEFISAQKEVSKFVETQKDAIFNDRIKAIEDRFSGLMEQQKMFFEKQINFQNEMSKQQLQIEIERKTFELEKKYKNNEPNVFEQFVGAASKFIEALPEPLQETIGEVMKNYAMNKLNLTDLSSLNEPIATSAGDVT